MSEKEWEFKVVSSLSKTYLDSGPTSGYMPDIHTAFVGEEYSFQVALRRTSSGSPTVISIAVDERSRPFSSFSEVVSVPCDVAAFADHDSSYDRDTPGMYPDLLKPLLKGQLTVSDNNWRAIWVDFTTESLKDAGKYTLHLELMGEERETLLEHELQIEVLESVLPPLGIINTHWFHCDGLATYYGLKVFSEPHWKVIENFLQSARRISSTAIMTPIWTPPLDTEVGSYRTPTQLIRIKKHGDKFSFDFSLLQRWIVLVKELGFTYLEVPHLFSQWGAAFAPAFYLDEPGSTQPIFGWHTDSASIEYQDFLNQFLPKLVEFLSNSWDINNVIFHISDEPHGPDQLVSYQAAKNIVEKHISHLTVIDALSDFELYKSKTVDFPVIANDAVEPFLDADIEKFMIYYCVAQNIDVSNRFFALPSYRNRILGHQLFAFKVRGFLHWGFNFYNSKLSITPIDPFSDTTGSGAFPGGDTFLVYPGINFEPWESIRFKVLAQAMNDYRAFSKLAELSSHALVKEYIDHDGKGGRLKFDAFSQDPEYYFTVRNQINREIMGHIQ